MDGGDEREWLAFIIGEGQFRFDEWKWTLGSFYTLSGANDFIDGCSFDSVN